MKNLVINFNSLAAKMKDIPLLALRLILAYGFFDPGLKKLQNIESTTEWFKQIGMPAPELNVYLSGGIETVGAVLIALGLGTRIMTIPMIITMVVAIVTVHWGQGFNPSGGYEIPVYYIIMLFTLMVFGSGRLSLDQLFTRKQK